VATVSVPIEIGVTARRRLDQIVENLIQERSTWERRWQDLGDYLLPTRPRFTVSDANRGDRTNKKILDSTATQSVDIARSGLLNGMASPSRPWFMLDTVSRRIEKTNEVLEWLTAFRDRILDVLERTNFYAALGQMFEDELVFGTAAMGIYEDPESIVRCHVFPVGSYVIAQDAAGRVNTFAREFRMTAQQAVEKFGIARVSHRTRMAYLHERYQEPIEVRHLIQPNNMPSTDSPYATDLPWKECYWEKGAQDGPDELLKESGYHEFPIIVARWERSDEDTYATRWPGSVALGDIKMLQAMERKIVNGLNKMVDPALVGSSSLKNRPVSLLSGEITYEDITQTGQGLRPIHEVRLPIGELEEKANQVRERIRHAFYVPYFLMLLSDARGQPPTAEEIRQRMREKLQVLGPVLERHSDDVFGPVIERVSAVMMRLAEPAWAAGYDGMVPIPPEDLEDAELRVEYISEVAQAQRMTGLAGLERHLDFAGIISQTYGPDVLDNIDIDEAMAEHASMVGISPKIRRDEREREAVRSARNQQVAMQQGIEAAPQLASAAKDLSQVDVDQATGKMRPAAPAAAGAPS
jgi:hypothetical protein